MRHSKLGTSPTERLAHKARHRAAYTPAPSHVVGRADHADAADRYGLGRKLRPEQFEQQLEQQ